MVSNKNNKALLGIGLVTIALGAYLLLRAKKTDESSAIWKVGDHIVLTLLYGGGTVYAIVTDVRWGSSYDQFEYSIYDELTHMQYGAWYLESQLAEWYTGTWQEGDIPEL